jgi:putative ABC transport system permease protein
MYRLLVAGDARAVARFEADAHGRVDGGKLRGVGLESLQKGSRRCGRRSIAPAIS